MAEEDLPILFEHQQDPKANRMASFSPRDREAFMAHWRRILLDEAVTCRTVVVDGQVAGNVVCFQRSGQWEVGYWIGRDHWGRGVATRALTDFVRLVPARPLYGAVVKDNVASIRVLEKCGFVVSHDASSATNASADVEMVLMKLDA
ncbi:MAG: GNAT family N-acetyltransferase [Actinobacteria bacterium]|nr:GNAT family N-acetyltransferase [Actinomycetota bacterium]